MSSITPSDIFTRHPSNPIITADQLPYRANSVFNPGAGLVGGETLLLVRVEDLRGISHLHRGAQQRRGRPTGASMPSL